MKTTKDYLDQHSFTDKETEKIIRGLFSDEYSYGENIIEMLDNYLNKDSVNKKEWFDWFSGR